MEQNLQTVLELIKAGAHLSEDEKAAIIARLNAADKKMGIDAFRIERGEHLKKTMSVLLEETIEELEQKRKAVEEKNRDLEIEASLERVRTAAMAMAKPDDLLNICKLTYAELQALGFKAIRNSQIFIFDDSRGAFINYGFSDDEGANIAEIFYDSHPKVKAFITTVRKTSDAFAELSISGDELTAWRQYRIDNGEPDDLRLGNIDSLYYYFYSIGIGAIGISNFEALPQAQRQILKRFRNVFDLAYRRYADIRLAEGQAREAQIELGLERVRARAMAMQQSTELHEVVAVVFEKLQALGVPSTATSINVWIEDSKEFDIYACGQNESGLVVRNFRRPPHFDHVIFNDQLDAWEKGLDFTEMSYPPKEKNSFYQYLFEHSGLRNLPADQKALVLQSEHYTLSTAFAKNSMIVVNNFEGKTLSGEENDILKRFAKVFDQAYTRFLDLQKAEAQACEARIELGLERVRARAMAMQTSGELSDLVTTVSNELAKLDFALSACIINIIDGESRSNTVWFTGVEDGMAMQSFHMKFEDYPFHDAMWDAWEAKKAKYVYTLQGQEKLTYDDYLLNETEFSRISDAAKAGLRAMERFVCSFTFCNFGGLQTVGTEPLSDANLDILSRFGKVFDLTYTRFNDLKQAEIQAREAQIELALERVRARTMAMQKSEELKEIIKVVYEQLVHLNIPVEHAGFIMDYNTRDDMHIWLADKHYAPSEITVPYFDSPHWNGFNEAKQKGSNFFAIYSGFEEKNKFYQDLFNLIPGVTDETKEYYFSCPGLAISTVLMDNVGLYIENFSGIPYTDEENNTLMRFGKVFQQTYTRFLDLQKAEAQVREAQIEAALERVRSRTMAMQKSEELAETAFILFQQFKELGENPDQATIGIINEEEHVIDYWVTMYGSQVNKVFKFPIDEPIVTHEIYKAWKANKTSLVIDLSGKDLHTFTKYRESMGGAKFNPDEKRRVINVAFFSKGLINVQSSEERSAESIRLLERFAGVFDGTYTRFLDLQKAEAQVREAQIEAALERVRSKTMAMHNSQDVGDTVNLMFKELVKLGVDKIARCGIAIPDNNGLIELWTAKLGKDEKEEMIIGHIDTSLHPMLASLYNAWKGHQAHFEYILEGDDLDRYITALNNYPGYPIKYDPKAWGTRQHHNDFFFHEGMVFAFTFQPLSSEIAGIFKRFAGVFGQTYRRYLDLQKAEAQAKEAQIQLALERVRARTMAMQKSDELHEVIQLVFDQLQQLNFDIDVANFALNYQETDDLDLWLAVADAQYAMKICIPYFDHPVFTRFNKAKEKGGLFADTLSKDEKNSFFKHFFKYTPSVANERQALVFGHPGFARSAVFMKNTVLTIINYQGVPYSGAENNTLLRFGQVFDQTYTRFKDLEQAEEQAREAKIEASLERVRSRTMAMQHSDELKDVIQVIYEQLHQLNFNIDSADFNLDYRDTDDFNLWVGVPGRPYPAKMHIPYIDHPLFNRIVKAKVKVPAVIADCYTSDQKNTYFQHNFKFSPTPIPAERQDFILSGAGLAISTVLMTHVALSTMNYSGVPYTDADNATLMRFGKVFEQTYTRFKDLEQAEAQAKESQIQLALERVRARTMAMQKSEELAETATVLFQQLHNLGISSERTFIGMPNDDTRKIELWGTEQGGNQMSTRFEYEADATYAFREIYKAWLEKKSELTVILKGKNLQEHVNYVRNVLHMPLLEELVQEQRILYNAFFSKGLLMIVTPDAQPKETLEILERFAAVFDQTYTRFRDLQRAEAQAREAQIQLGLERVRAAAMAMHSSADVGNATALVFSELHSLGVNTIRCGVLIIEEATKFMEVWSATSAKEGKVEKGSGKLDLNSTPFWQKTYNAWKEKKSVFTYELAGQELADYYSVVAKAAGYRAPQQTIDFAASGNISEARQYCCVFMFPEGAVFTFTEEPISAEFNQVLARFTAVFALTYRRYLDLQKAEAQVREAQIEAALERVRSKTMAMHNSQDVGDTVGVMFHEFVKLGIEKMIRCGIGIMSHENRTMELWTAKWGENEKINLLIGHLDMTIHKMLGSIYDAWKSKQSDFAYQLAGNDLVAYAKVINSYPDYPLKYDLNSLPPAQFFNDFYFNEGVIFAFTSESLSDEIVSILRRFAGVFGQTYRRYLDLQKAEAQAKESQIQLALERVRARTMAMQKSDELAETSVEVFKQLINLGIEPNRLFIGIIKDNSGDIELWATDEDGSKISTRFTGNMRGNRSVKKMYDGWKSHQKSLTIDMKGKELKDYFRYLVEELKVPFKLGLSSKRRVQSIAYFSQGFIGMASPEEQPKETIDLMERFAGVFNLTYTRFNDLKLAEEQARESKIEASLERVRGKAMAMRNSNDLSVTASMVFTELRNLGINPIRSGVGLITKETRKAKIYSDTSLRTDTDLSLIGEVTLSGHSIFELQYQAWLKQENCFAALGGNELAAYYKILSVGLNADLGVTGKIREKEYGHWFMFSEGFLYAWSDKRYTEAEIKILERFKNVIELTFRRYIELQKSEAIARDAVKEASLDRVRAEIASMRKRSDLERITPLIWNELTILGIPFIRCGVFIMDEDQKLIHTFLSTPDGKAIGAFHVPFDTSGNFEKMVDSWRHGVPYIDHWEEEAFSQFADTLVKQGAIASKAQYMRTLPHEGIHLNFLPFLQGMLYVGNIEPLTEDNISLIQAVADAFSTAYARYEDFNKLEAAKQQVDNTLTDLKATQTKLIQSEKMASLGELTAGIAHEIQNPLNFVNNFSEVNQEMLDELEEELKAGNIEDALAIAADLKGNEQKINHHGKRADAIVKGMLQHSRTGGGEKQPTNMNALADEFLRLSYHGLRAKDKMFNAELVTDFDPNLPKISVIGQDMGRVMLNLFNNAFYAVNQKMKATPAGYKPEVAVSTATENGQVVIKVKDNGVGMPEHIKEKIMQPFFTTKPTGEGTGLGLSLTYDMVVKGHGGTIQVNSVEGEGSEFIIQLPNN